MSSGLLEPHLTEQGVTGPPCATYHAR